MPCVNQSVGAPAVSHGAHYEMMLDSAQFTVHSEGSVAAVTESGLSPVNVAHQK